MPPVCRRDGNRGIALVVVLWVLVLLAMIAASVTVGARTGVSLASNLNASARAEALADAGIARAVMTLSTRRRAAGDARLNFLCELGPKEYAMTGPDGYELSDRWQEALLLKERVRAIWDAEAGA